MRRLLLVVLSALTLSVMSPTAPATAAEHGPIGLGLMLGDPTGFTGKILLSDMIALNIVLGAAWYNGNNFHTHVDVTFQFDLKKWPLGALDIYFGVGPKFGWFWTADTMQFGFRAPIGLTWEFERYPVEVFAELGPGAWLLDPGPGFDLDASVGARYFF